MTEVNWYPEMPAPPKFAADYESRTDTSETRHPLEEENVNTHPPPTLVEEVKIFNHNCWQGLTTAGSKGTYNTCSSKAAETFGIGTPNYCGKLQERRDEERRTSAEIQTERYPEKNLQIK